MQKSINSDPPGYQTMQTDSTGNGESLAAENSRLKQTLNDLLTSAKHNQQTQDRFYALELHFLQSRTIESLLQRILIDLKTQFRLSQVELVLIDPEQEIRRLINEIYGELEHVNLHFVDKIEDIRPFYQGPVRLKLTQDLATIQALFVAQPQQSKSVAQLPLMRGTEMLGSLHLGSRDVERFHHGLATNFLQHLASIISVCLENSVNQEKFIHLSLVDMLTRVKNRRYFFQALAREIARATRSKTPLACLFIDIDYFKSINDQHGHQIGDRALRAVANGITPLLRKSDTLARFGGEEFTVLLPSCSNAEANEIAERIREQVAQLIIENAQHEPLQLTISIGISHWDPATRTFDNAEKCQNFLINMADKGVYLAKSDGRNCVRQHLVNQAG